MALPEKKTKKIIDPLSRQVAHFQRQDAFCHFGIGPLKVRRRIALIIGLSPRPSTEKSCPKPGGCGRHSVADSDSFSLFVISTGGRRPEWRNLAAKAGRHAEFMARYFDYASLRSICQMRHPSDFHCGAGRQ